MAKCLLSGDDGGKDTQIHFNRKRVVTSTIYIYIFFFFSFSEHIIRKRNIHLFVEHLTAN
jgi:hypothetical protein